MKIAGIEFDNVFYDADGDVLYLHVGDPGTAVDFGGTPEGHHTRYGPDGTLVGLTILNARWLLEREGKIVITLPEQRVETLDLGDVLAAARLCRPDSQRTRPNPIHGRPCFASS